MRHARVVIVAGVALALGGAVWAWRAWTPVAREELRASGTIEATEVGLSFRIPGRVVARPIEEGSRVEAGAVVGRLESRELEAEVARLRAVLAATETLLPQLETEIALREELTRRRIAEAESVVAARQARLAELRSGTRQEDITEGREAVLARRALLAGLRAGSRTQEVQRAQAEVREAEALVDSTRRELDRMDALYRRDLVAARDRDQARTAFDVAAERRRQAVERLRLVEEGPRPEEIDRAEAEVRQAEASLARLEAGPRPEEIQRAEAEVRQAEASLRAAQAGELEVTLVRQRVGTLEANRARDRAALGAAEAQLDYTVLRSPLAGVALRVHVEPGEVIAAGTPVLTLVDLGQVWLKIYVPEPRLGLVKLGQRADVTTDSYPGKVYPGTVTFIGSEAEFTPKSVQTEEVRVKLVFAVKVSVENPDQELKPGMPADAALRLR